MSTVWAWNCAGSFRGPDLGAILAMFSRRNSPSMISAKRRALRRDESSIRQSAIRRRMPRLSVSRLSVSRLLASGFCSALISRTTAPLREARMRRRTAAS